MINPNAAGIDVGAREIYVAVPAERDPDAVRTFAILEERGIEVCLVNARHLRRVPGRKTDVLDCEWLQYLHSVGLSGNGR